MPIHPNHQIDGESDQPERSLMYKWGWWHPSDNPPDSTNDTSPTGDSSDASSNPRASPVAQSDSAQPSNGLDLSSDHAGNGSENKEFTGSPLPSNRSFDLNNDFTDRPDIVQQRAVSPTHKSPPQSPAARDRLENDLSKTDWSAPESSDVTKQDTEEEALDQENSPVIAEDIAESSIDIEDKEYRLRIFRLNDTFATLSVRSQMTVSQMIQVLARRSISQDIRGTYELFMWGLNRFRGLDMNEKPVLIQKQLLELAGYQPSDGISDVGLEDNSYLYRFMIIPAPHGRFSSWILEPDFSDSTFRDIVLRSQGLVTIPTALFTHSNEIVTLDLSCNPTVKVPKDFIQRCHCLHEIKFVGNEIRVLPASFSYAEHLRTLDISNNRITSLDPPRLSRLRKLVSLNLANNKLDKIPDYFSELTALSSVDLSWNKFAEIPTVLSGICELDISFNNLTTIKGISHIQRLRKLWITNNKLRGAFADEIAQLQELREINARHNMLNNIDILTQLPNLLDLQLGHNVIFQFVGSFKRLRKLSIDYCPVTVFDINKPTPSLVVLNVTAGKLVFVQDSIFGNVPNLAHLNLNKNRLIRLSPQVGTLRKLESLSIVENRLLGLPFTIGCLTELRYLNVRGCNISTLPPEIWYCNKLHTLNVASNVLEALPPIAGIPPVLPDTAESLSVWESPSPEETSKIKYLNTRPPRSISNVNTSGVALSGRNTSVPSFDGRNPPASSFITRNTDKDAKKRGSKMRRDSTFSQILTQTFALSLHFLSLADNQLDNDVYHQLALLQELRVLNLSYNALSVFPSGLLKRWIWFSELYISGNELTSLPAGDLEESSLLRVLHINGNKFQVLPSELSRLHHLTVLDAGSNSLRYDVSNWRYYWNWNWNTKMKYLNLSGNKRFGIKHRINATTGEVGQQSDLVNFDRLHNLRVLGLMDVTSTDAAFPDETNDHRIHTSATITETCSYGMADTLGRTNHLSVIDVTYPRFRGNSSETVLALLDGTPVSDRSSSIATYLQQNMKLVLVQELNKLREGEEVSDALRRTFLTLNRDMGNMAYKAARDKDVVTPNSLHEHPPAFYADDNNLGATAAVLFVQELTLYAANVGNVEILLIQTSGYRKVTDKHVPTGAHERARIHRAGGYVSRSGKLNGEVPVSRAFGYFAHMPAMVAAPTVRKLELTDEDDMIIIASSELWDHINPDVVSHVVRGSNRDPMLAAQKLRDLAIAYGATNKVMVMAVDAYDLRQRERIKGWKDGRVLKSALGTERVFPTVKRFRRTEETTPDADLAPLEKVDPPTGDIAIVFTDIKGSTQLWENNAAAMQSAIQMHNDLFRRQLIFMGGYEIKTEGDAFMVAFKTPTAALLWCFACQGLLLEEDWPEEIIKSETGREQRDVEQKVIFRGLTVRMGIHWGDPLSERDPVTGRMDYFGPVVNRAARISAMAEGGEVYVSSDFMAELRRVLLLDARYERINATTSSGPSLEEMAPADLKGNAASIRRELGLLSLQGWELEDRGEHRLKGLESPEFPYLIYPSPLKGRVPLSRDSSDKKISLAPERGEALLGTKDICALWRVATRLEQVCSAMESSEAQVLDDSALIDATSSIVLNQEHGQVLPFFEHIITRIEACINTLLLRNVIYPFPRQMQEKPGPISMNTIWSELAGQLDRLQNLSQLDKQVFPQNREDSASFVEEEENLRNNVTAPMSEEKNAMGDRQLENYYDDYTNDNDNSGDPYDSNGSGDYAADAPDW